MTALTHAHLRHIRLSLGLRQKDLADMLGISRRHLQYLESGDRTPSGAVAVAYRSLTSQQPALRRRSKPPSRKRVRLSSRPCQDCGEPSVTGHLRCEPCRDMRRAQQRLRSARVEIASELAPLIKLAAGDRIGDGGLHLPPADFTCHRRTYGGWRHNCERRKRLWVSVTASGVKGSVRRFVLGPFCQTLTNLSPKMTANCVLASNHSRGGRFHASAA